MTLLSVIKDVCAAVGVLVPQSVFSNINANRTMQEMLALANEMAQRIAYDTREWTMLHASYQFGGGDGFIPFQGDAFPLPNNFKRLLLNSNLWRSSHTTQPARFIPNIDEWYQRRSAHYSDAAVGEWTITGGNILTYPAFNGSQRLIYLDKNCVNLVSGGVGDRFVSDADSFRLDERLLKLGMVWQWKAQKGSPYNEDLGNYSDALAYAMGHDSPAPIIIGRRGISLSAKTAYPYPVPTP